VRPPLSVVVPTRDRPEQLDACLRALRSSTGADDELIVVDSASTGPEPSAVGHRHGATVLRQERAGASRARNAGWRAARHDLVAFVDDDVRVRDRWADAMVAAFVEFPRVDFVTGLLGLPPGLGWTDVPIAVIDRPEAGILDAGTAEILGHSANLGVRRAALEAVGGFDERLGAGADLRAAEDNDLWDRLLRDGRIGRYEPAAAGWHEQWRTRRELIPLNWSYGFGSGARIAKLLRSDRTRARSVARVAFWDWGVRDAPRWLPRHRLAALLGLVRAAGAAAGLLRAAPIPVVDGHFAAARDQA
jgi:glycosyltransferase involved in cell wall biosynthesis